MASTNSVVRASKYRHVFGTPDRKEICYDNIRIGSISQEINPIKANKTYFAVPWQVGGGGSICVWPIARTGRLPDAVPTINGHTAPILDFAFSPFDDNLLVTGSEDSHIKLWRIPEGGPTETITTDSLDINGHQQKVNLVDFHPLINGLLVTASTDSSIRLWDLEHGGQEKIKFDLGRLAGHTTADVVYSISWNYDGSLFASSHRDKKLRICDPRGQTIAGEVVGHDGSKASRVVFLGNREKLLSVGFTKMSERQVCLWDARNLSQALKSENMDHSNGSIFPFYDSGTGVAYLLGKGDSNIRLYEITDSAPFLHQLTEHRSATPQRGAALLPKVLVDVRKNETVRFLRLTDRNVVEPLSFFVPRKSEFFQDDIYPETFNQQPVDLASDDWMAGENKEPTLVSLKPEGMQAQSEVATDEKKGPKYNFDDERKKAEPSKSSQHQVFDQLFSSIAHIESKQKGPNEVSSTDDDW